MSNPNFQANTRSDPTSVPHADERIDAMFEEQVRRSPSAAAVVSGGRTLTYEELDRKADEVASMLRTRGIRPERLVGIYLEKSPEMVVAILGVLKAGGAYVPIDPNGPPDRIADAPLEVVLASADLMPRLSRFSCPVVLVDELVGSVAPEASATARRTDPGDLAYVIYTSGSSGKPKGVAVEHRSLAHSIRARIAYYPAPQAFLLLSAMAFDSAVAGIFGTLLRGGALHIPPPGTEADPRLIGRLIKTNGIDTTLTLPSVYELLLDAAEPGALESLRTVIVAGERCPPRLVAKSVAAVPSAQLYNEYGPTEGTVWCSVWACPDWVAPEMDIVPIGKPILGVDLTVVDPSGRRVAPGESGELCISGPTLARGYHSRPDLTAQYFEPDPYGAPGNRRYRTGDLVRQHEDGNFELLGRLDRQVKVQGFRVEPGEIEDTLVDHDEVRQAAVLPDPRRPSTTLVAFVVGDVDPRDLRDFADQRLPGWMVPHDFIPINFLPLTVNGKVDMTELQRRLTAESPEEATDDLRTAAELLAADVWCEVLQVDHVERSRSFYEQGGSSLDAVRVALRLSEALEAEIPMLWVYEAPTVERLAEWLTQHFATPEAIRSMYTPAEDTRGQERG